MRSRKESQYGSCEIIRLIGHRYVPGISEDYELGPCDGTLILPSQPGQDDRVAFTPNEKSGRLNVR